MKAIKSDGFELEYTTIGQGNKTMLAFHGFNRHADDFRVFESSLGQRFTIFSFNLFHYGNSRVTIEDQTFEKKHLKKIVSLLQNEEGFSSFSTLGYSLGGKLALCCLELFPEEVEEIYLLAPDGIKQNVWYNIASNSLLGRNLYKYLIKKPEPFFRLAGWLRDKKIITNNLHGFVVSHMATEDRRKKVFDVWMVFRKLNPDIKKIVSILNSGRVNAVIFFGKYDRIIPVEIGKKFQRLLKKPEMVRFVNEGHQLVTYRMNTHLKNN